MIGTAAQIVSFLMDADRDKQWELREHKERRSLSQNGYYWTLCTKVASKLRRSTAYVHNKTLREHPHPFLLDGKTVLIPLPDTDDAEEAAMESQTFHVKPCSQVIVGKDGQRLRTYMMIRGSSDYDTSEMSVLLDDLIEEAKLQGIETITPNELEKIRKYERETEARKIQQKQRREV